MRHPLGMTGGIGISLIDHVGERENGLMVILAAFPLKPRHLFPLPKRMDGKADVARQFLEHGDFFRLKSLFAHGIDAECSKGCGVAVRTQRQGNHRPEFDGIGPVKPGQ